MPFKIFIITALIIVVLSMLAMLIRVILGPSLVVILMVGILAFLGTAVFSKFMDEGKVIKHDSNDRH